jgi:hypothetical protein
VLGFPFFVQTGIISQLLVFIPVSHQITQKRGRSLLDQIPGTYHEDEILCTFKNDLNDVQWKRPKVSQETCERYRQAIQEKAQLYYIGQWPRGIKRYAKSEQVAKHGRQKHMKKPFKNQNAPRNA